MTVTHPYRATVVGFHGSVIKVYDQPADDVSPAAWLFVLWPTSVSLILWPADLIRPVREALTAGRGVDLRKWKAEERERKRLARERRKVYVEASDENDQLAAELGLL